MMGACSHFQRDHLTTAWTFPLSYPDFP
jgi:hypothetical protein